MIPKELWTSKGVHIYTASPSQLRKFLNCPADLSLILRRRFLAPLPLTATDFSNNVGSNPAPECSSHCHNARSYESSPCWRYKRPCSAQEEEQCLDGAVSSNP
ncbi:hypothetical protein NL676_001075 [Syzygium grande]|nr:hypothetical protein NL676_001075 [Syzygium grande]